MICVIFILINICSDEFIADGLIRVRLQHDKLAKEDGAKMIDNGDDILIVWLQKDVHWARKEKSILQTFAFFSLFSYLPEIELE